MFRRTTFTRTLSLIFVLLILAFIWGNSLLPGTESAAVSGGLAALLERIFGPAANFEQLHHLLGLLTSHPRGLASVAVHPRPGARGVRSARPSTRTRW